MVNARNLKYGARIDLDECDSKNVKLGTKGAWHMSRNQFWDPLYISGTAKDRNLKSRVHIDYYEYYSKQAKLKDQRAVV